MPGLLGGSRRHGAISADDRDKRSSSMILAVPLARQGADEDQVMLVTATTTRPTDAGQIKTRNARRHLPGDRVPTPRLPDGGLRENRATEPPIRGGLSHIRRGSVWPTI